MSSYVTGFNFDRISKNAELFYPVLDDQLVQAGFEGSFAEDGVM